MALFAIGPFGTKVRGILSATHFLSLSMAFLAPYMFFACLC